jgi:AraC-type DNA-binding domain-containing proteins
MKSGVQHIETIQEHHKALGYPALKHPLMSICRFQDVPPFEVKEKLKFTLGFYTITLKKDYECKSTYGQTSYDFDEGLMGFFAPRQVSSADIDFISPKEGWMLFVHPDFFKNSVLAGKINSYNYFHYAVNEALILSDEEESEMEHLFKSIQSEYHRPIDHFSKDVLISKIDLLLTLCNRFYHRQFITRKTPNSDLLSKFELLLDDYFNSKDPFERVPTVSYFSEKLNMTGKYLSDVLVSLTGQSTLNHIHNKLIDKAKEKLSTTNLTVNEIAYQLGFEHSQSFSKLFKNKTNLSPMEFRQSFN